MALKSEVMLVRCPMIDCDSGLKDIGEFGDLERQKVRPFTLECATGHMRTYQANDIMRESDWPNQFKQEKYVHRRKEFMEQQVPK